MAIQKERFEIVSRRRLADDSDDVALFTGSPVPGDHSKLFKRPNVDRRGQNDNDDTVMRGGADGEDEDESTREDLEPRSVVRTTRRAERQRRYQEEDPSSVPKGTVYPDPIADPGYSSDSALSAADSSDLAAALALLRDALERLFDDVKVDDYRDPNLAIRAKFEEWRELWREEYDMSFGALGLVGVWEFWARVEMSSWNPFDVSLSPQLSLGFLEHSVHCMRPRSNSCRKRRRICRSARGTTRCRLTVTEKETATKRMQTRRKRSTSRPKSSMR